MYLSQVRYCHWQWHYLVLYEKNGQCLLEWFSKKNFESLLFQHYRSAPCSFQLLYNYQKPMLGAALHALDLHYVEITSSDVCDEFSLYYHHVQLKDGCWKERTPQGEYLRCYLQKDEAIERALRLTPHYLMPINEKS